MGYQLSLRTQVAMIQALQLVGGATDSIFPQAEALLIGNNDYAEALEHVGSRKNMEKYHSMMDFLFCELHPEWRRHCRRYYSRMGPPLRESLSAEQLVEYNRRLLIALEVALQRHTEKLHTSWGWYRELVNEAALAS